MNQSGGAITPLLQKAGANLTTLKSCVQQALVKVPTLADSTGDVQGSQALGRLLNRADKLAQERTDTYISSDVVLLAMMEKSSPLAPLMFEAGLSEPVLKKAIDDVRGGDGVQSADAEEQRQALEKYTVDLTARAEAGELDPVIGRDDEIRRTIQVLQRQRRRIPSSSASPAWVKPRLLKGWLSA